MKKVLRFLLNNSNSLLIFITLVTLIMFSYISLESSRRAGLNLLNSVTLYTDILNTDESPDYRKVSELLSLFSGKYFGNSNMEVELLLEKIKAEIEDSQRTGVSSMIRIKSWR